MTTDQIARFAELIAATDLSRPVRHPYRRPLFRAVPLGDKYPTADFLVDVLGPDDRPTGFFFVQVKGTTAVSATAPRIPIDVSQERFNRLARLTAPAYLLAVDVGAERTYLAAATRPRKSPVASMTKAFPAYEDRVKIHLHQEVCAFWNEHKQLRRQSRFHDV
jgi:hypothetical protein